MKTYCGREQSYKLINYEAKEMTLRRIEIRD